MADLQLENLKKRIPSASENDLAVALEDAKDAILARRYPFGNRSEYLESRYLGLQIRLAVVLYNKRGAEGESAHSENGVSRSYESADELLKEVTPLGMVL